LPDLAHLETQFSPSEQESESSYNPYKIFKLQSYNPTYQSFFNNVENITFNNTSQFIDLHTVQETDGPRNNKPVFIKFSPLLDPIRYMIGKYNIDDERTISMPNPTSTETDCLPKLLSPNNASYVDCFFSYLSSQMLHTHGLLSGIDFYGSYLGVQDMFKMNVEDDLEYLNTSKHFLENTNKLFTLTKSESTDYLDYGSRGNKHKLRISSNVQQHNISAVDLGSIELIDDANALECREPTASINIQNVPNPLERAKDESFNHCQIFDKNETREPLEQLIYEKNDSSRKSSSTHSSTCSTNTSNNSELNYSSDDDNDNDETEKDKESDDEDDTDDNWSDVESSDESGESEQSDESDSNDAYAFIKNFPIQMICLEKCKGTLDDLFERGKLDENEAASAMIQIIMTLIVYQKAFHFTHNDLHTNNIMYVNTDLEYLYYRYDGNTYKVPTYGKIYKLIDFGRSIYKVQGKLFCSDSFAVGGDATTQYNFEPFMNEDKPRIDPNYSFDLCRLGCSIYDFVIDDDDEDDIKHMDEFQKTIKRWCTDDNGKNILYKKNGEERYPNFKLYKMIARTVHKHTPQMQLEFDFFKQFKQNSGEPVDNIMDIDKIPCYV
jgi:hypothetical protein